MRLRILLTAMLLAGCGTDISGPSAALFDCFVAQPISLELGQAWQVGGGDNQGLCLEPQTPGAEYVFIPFFGRERPSGDERLELALELMGAGFEAAVGPPSPDPRDPAPLLPGAAPADRLAHPRSDLAFHRRLRAREIAELEPRIRAAPGRRPSGAAALRSPVTPGGADVPTPGQLLDFNVATDCEETDIRTGRVIYVSGTAIVVADTANPDGMSSEDFRHFGEAFDTLVDPLMTAHFGEPTDIDDNDRAIIFFTRAVNELSSPDGTSFTLGFFWSGDLFPETATDRLEACPATNRSEMFYMVVADPDGEAGPAFGVEFVRNYGVAILAHEYQHLINASRRLYVNEASTLERSWLNEGLSHIAEELVFYAASGLSPRSNLTVDDLRATPERLGAFNTFMAPGNFANLLRYLQRPDTASLMGLDLLPTRGATWSFLRYAADRSDRSDAAFFHDLTNSRTAGMANLDAVLGGSALDWMRDWTVAVYADDAVPDIDPRFRQPSWDFRDIYSALQGVGRYPLRTIEPQDGQALALDLLTGGAAFVRFGVATDGRAVIRVESGGDVPPAALRGSLMRTR